MPLARDQRNRAGRRDEARRRLLAAIEQMLCEGTSFKAIKVEQLAKRAGMSRATFYIHFQDKLELLEQWQAETREEMFAVSRVWYDAAPSLSREELRTAIAAILALDRERMTLMTATHETALYDATLRDDFAEAFETHVVALARHIRRGQKAGAIEKRLPARETAEWLICMIERVPTRIPLDASEREVAAHVEAATEVTWSTLYTPSN